MKITVLCSDPLHPIDIYLERWVLLNKTLHEISIVRRKSDLIGGDILFLVSCSQIIDATDRAPYGVCLVLHASDLPVGRGWSPHIWAIIKGAEKITVSLLEADDQVDSGKIWKKIEFQVPKHALWNEINESLFEAEIELMNFALENFNDIVPVEQNPKIIPSYYPRRTFEDSKIDTRRSLEEQFDQIRVCDPLRFPAFFYLHGHRYNIILERINGKVDID